VPFALQPKAREERIEILEKGFQLEDDGRLTIGAVPSSRTKMMLVDVDVVCPPKLKNVYERRKEGKQDP
jgi:hypothetical protein